MTAEIICVGTEILLGNIVNTNAAYLAEKLAASGLDCYYQTVVGDNAERLAGVLKCAMERSDVILLSGGLGPTEDDLTKETVAKVCGKKLSVDDHSMERIAEFFAVRDIQPTENNWKQAMVPEGAKVLDNDNGTAPGIILETEKNRIVLLPGPPAELIPMFDQQILPYLDALTPGVICSQMVKLCGVPESQVEDTLKDLIDGQTNPTIATYAKTGEVHIRVTASGENAKAAGKTIKPIVKELKSRFGGDIYSTREETTLEIKGRNLVDGLPKNVVVHSEDVREALLECLVKITSAIKETLERTPPELSADIIDHGITLSGGGALLRGLDQLISNETGIDVHVAETPLDCVALGSGAVLDHIDKLGDVLDSNSSHF